MAVVVTTSLVALLFVFLGKYEKRFDWLKIAFILVTFIACIHYNYGNDYNAYYLYWEDINNNSPHMLFTLGGFSGLEPGWIILNKLFGFTNGFYYMVATINIIEGSIYYKCIKKFIPGKNYFWPFFLYVFTPEFYLLNFSMMRQGFAMALVLLSVLYFCEKDYKRTVIILTTAITMHISAVVVVPFLIICKFIGKMQLCVYRLVILLTPLLIIFMYSFSSKLFDVILSLSFFSKYKFYYTGNLYSGSVGLGFLLMLFPYFVMIYFMAFRPNTVSTEEKYLTILAFILTLTKPFEFVGAALVIRIGYYFSVFNILIVPILYSKIRQPLVRLILYTALVIITVGGYIGFYNSPSFRDAFSEFHTIFD